MLDKHCNILFMKQRGKRCKEGEEKKEKKEKKESENDEVIKQYMMCGVKIYSQHGRLTINK